MAVVHVGGKSAFEKFKHINVLGTFISCILKQFRVAQFNKESCLTFEVFPCLLCALGFVFRNVNQIFFNLMPSNKGSTIFHYKHLQ